MTLPEAIAWLACLAVIGFAAIWAIRRYPGESKAPASTRGQLPRDFDYAKDEPRDVTAPGAPTTRR